MKINYYEPSERLKKNIRCYWSAYEEDFFAVLPTFIPGTGNELIINLAEPFELKSSEESVIIRDSGLMKIRKNPVMINRIGKLEIFSIRFRAGAFYNFCKENVGTIKKELFSSEEILTSIPIFKEITQFKSSDKEKINIIEEVLEQLLKKFEKSLGIEHIVDEIFYNYDTININLIANENGISVRKLERDFKEVTGFSPKHFTVYSRFHHTIKSLILDKKQDYKDIILDKGYYDQAHFIKTFKFFTGTTPMKYLNNSNFENHFFYK